MRRAPVVAVQDVGLAAGLEQELQRGLAEEVEPHLVIVPVYKPCSTSDVCTPHPRASVQNVASRGTHLVKRHACLAQHTAAVRTVQRHPEALGRVCRGHGERCLAVRALLPYGGSHLPYTVGVAKKPFLGSMKKTRRFSTMALVT